MNLISSLTGFSFGEEKARTPETVKPVYTGMSAEMMRRMMDTVALANSMIPQIEQQFQLKEATNQLQKASEVSGATTVQHLQRTAQVAPAIEPLQDTMSQPEHRPALSVVLQPPVTFTERPEDTPVDVANARAAVAAAYGPNPLWHVDAPGETQREAA